jgi:indolepyruvate ferredoxin oxidoreductase
VSTHTPIRSDVTLEDKYTAESGPVMLGGIQALVRLMLDVRRMDQRRGHDTGVFITGYQGSPLGGLDQELARARRLLEPAGVVFHPGLNEELAATAVGGTQLIGELDGRSKEGVAGFWYGKNPGLDRAADAIRHSNLTGTAPLGGAVALIGDDPSAKSSTVPSGCESTCRSLVLPLLAPGSVADLLTLGLHAVALSRHAGTWAAIKVLADVADAAEVVEVGAALDQIPSLAPRLGHHPPVLLPPSNLVAEHDLFTARLDRVYEYARLARLNRVTFDPRRPRIGIVASGIGYQAVLRALADLDLDELALEAIGVRLIQMSMPWPLADSELRELTAGLYTVLVVEDKLPFVESRLKEALYREASPPIVLGKEDQDGRPLLPVAGAVTADDVAVALARVLPDEWMPESVRTRLRDRLDRELNAAAGQPVDAPYAVAAKRTPYFCSGCPHNISTRADPGQLVGVGIGCHTMVALDHDERRGHLLGMPPMGAEGAQWFGIAPFVSEPHFIQNMGDGTFHHSGSLVIRAAVASGVNMTYRLLYNDAVAMTGGQHPEGMLSIPDLIEVLAREGVRQVAVTTPEPENYRGVTLNPIATVYERDDYQDVQDELAAVPGVTVLIHDDRCATEKRRMRKRGKLETPPEHAWINERVCEGCGDCGEKSSCLSVLPVQTQFGRKTRIQQSSCNQDMTCIDGDCPSFVMVTPKRGGRGQKHGRKLDNGRPAGRPTPTPPANLPDPLLRVPEDVLIRMPGVGGTGVVTVGAILRMAAFLQGRYASGLEQTGLAQKGGPVISDLRISRNPIEGQIRASHRSVDVLLGYDLLGCVDAATLAMLDPERTVAVLNSDVTPTAANITQPDVPLPISARLIGLVRHHTRASDAFALGAESLSEKLFGDHMQANMLLVGAGFQHGALPLEAAAIERAIELNGAAVEANIAAFRWGRAAIADPAALERVLAQGVEPPPSAPETLDELLQANVAELTAYQDSRYANRYLEDVNAVIAVARERLKDSDGGERIGEAYARGLFKLMAYKDEYEVARLHLDTFERARFRAEFGDDVRVQVLLHPPLMRAFGLNHKLRFGASATPLFRVLRAGRRLRGTGLDPFGRAAVRRTERALIGEYRSLVATALSRLDPATAATVLEIAQLPELVRGYEEIKLAGVARMRTRATELIEALDAPRATERPILEVTLSGEFR